MQTGVDASKPASPSAGAIYFATDTKIIYQYNSGAWVNIASNTGSGGTISSLTSDVTASGSGAVAATVVSVGGSTAAAIGTATVAANSAVSVNTASTIVKRDASGNFAAGTATLASASVGQTNGVVFNDTSGTPKTVTLTSPTTVGTSYALKLPANVASSSGQALTSDTSGNLSWSTVSGAPTGAVSGDLGGTYPSPSVSKLQGTSVSATAPTTAGQVLRYNGSSWVPNFVAMTDLRSTVTGTNAFASTCASNQTLSYNSVGDIMSCVNISLPVAQVTGVLPITNGGTGSANGSITGSGALAFAAGGANQSISLTATGTGGVGIGTTSPQTALDVAGSIRLSGMSTTCGAATEGSLRYNSTSKVMEYCNATAWGPILAGTIASIGIGSPSSSLVAAGPVTFAITYGSGTDTATVTLNVSKVTLGGTGTAGCTVSSVTGSGYSYSVTVNGCTGTGTVNISLVAGTANSTTGTAASAAGPSTSYNDDNTGPNAPTGVALGSVPTNLTTSPTVSWMAATDIGGSTVASYQAQVLRTSDSAVMSAWATLASGGSISGMSLATNTSYTVYVRGIDALGNIGTSTAGNAWTSINDPCLGSPTPGTVCAGGPIFLGNLSPGATSGSGTNHYMTTPGGCSDIPAGSVSGGSGTTSYALSTWTPASCSGTDATTKTWNDGSSNYAGILAHDYTTTTGTGNGAVDTDYDYGSTNTTNIAAITAAGSGGYHAAARYCNKLNYGGYTDWFLPNRFELNLMWTNAGSIPGLDTTGNYYSASTEYGNAYAWVQRFNDGYQNYSVKPTAYKVRCVRKF